MILAVTMCFGFASCGNENSAEESVPVALVTEPPTTKSGYTNVMDIIEDAKEKTVDIVSALGIADDSDVSKAINLIELSNNGKNATLELNYINPTTSDTKIYDASFTLVGTIANQLKLETVHSGESDDVFQYCMQEIMKVLQ